MTTYATDADIEELDPLAANFLPSDDSGVFTRLRGIAYAEIGRRLSRREPPVDAAVITDTTILTHAEVLYVLHRLYFDAAVKVGDMDTLKWRADQYRQEFEDEIANVRVPTYGDDGTVQLQSVKTVPIWRR